MSSIYNSLITSSIQLANVISLDWSYRVEMADELYSTPLIISKLTVTANSCNEGLLTEWMMSGNSNLRSIVVEENALSNLLTLNFTNLPSLQSIQVMDNALSKATL